MRIVRSLKRRLRKRRSEPSTLPTSPPPQPHPTVDVFAWQPTNGNRNFGDHLAHVIVETMVARNGKTVHDEVATDSRLLAVGSVLHFARDGDTVWGSGVNGKMPLEQLTARELDIRAVRGRLTARTLRERGHSVPDVYGDPALLIPSLFPDRFRHKPERDYVVVPNLHDLAIVPDDEPVVSPLWGWNHCVAEILRAKFVVASSLHGIIVAEAFGIPARYVRLSETESRFKYDDYASGTGRDELTPAFSIAEALDMGGHPPIIFNPAELMAAFPYDLWQEPWLGKGRSLP